MPTKTFESASRSSREYTIDAVIDGREEAIKGTACRQLARAGPTPLIL